MLTGWNNQRIECYIKRGLDNWVPSHTSQIKKGDIFKILEDDGYYEAYDDAVFTTDGWRVEAAWFKEGFVKC